jgi:nitroimidazol reductase NimA-like FMN-containing flavoprotein (pyridoxamine 5'-phosphate oxidase superfamily)
MSYGFDEATSTLYFHAATDGLKIDIITDNPDICGTVLENHGYIDTECEQHYRSLVYRGRMSVLTTLAEKKHGMNILLNHQESTPEPLRKRKLGSDTDFDTVAVLKIEITEMSGKEGK